MIAILEKYEHNVEFHQIVDFVEASHIRIETTNEGTKILATVDGKPRTISESSIRRNLKLNDEAGISSLPDAELFENLALMSVLVQKVQVLMSSVAILSLLCPSFSGRTVPLFDSMLVHQGEGSGTPNEPNYTPSPEAQHSSPTPPSSTSLPTATTKTITTVIPTDIPTLRQYSRRARIAQSLALPTTADEPASPLGDDSQREACLTVSGLKAGQDKASIIKTSTFPHDSTPRVTSLAADKGSMQHQLTELTDLCTRLQRQQTKMATKIAAQDLEIANLNARIKMLKDKDAEGVEKSTKRGSNDTKELVNVLTSLDATSILTSEVQVVSVPPAAEVTIICVPTCSGMVPTASPIFTTASVVTPYVRRNGKEKMVESDTPKKKKLQEQIDVQEYELFAADLSIGERIDMINELVKYQDHYAKVLKYQSQQRKPLSKKQQREFYMSVLKSHSGWKTKHFIGMTLDKIREKFIPIWKQIEDFVPMASKEEGERFKRKGLSLEQDSAKKVKTSEEESEDDLKAMMQLVLVEEVYMEALQVKHPIIDWEIHIEGQRNYWKIIRLGGDTSATRDKEKELWVELKRLYEPDVKNQLDQEIFMLAEKDYPLRKGLAIVMISNKLQVENYSQMASDLIQKIHKIANSLRQRDD
nr:hypothetical protein [Tanacetum cinerariifolium]